MNVLVLVLTGTLVVNAAPDGWLGEATDDTVEVAAWYVDHASGDGNVVSAGGPRAPHLIDYMRAGTCAATSGVLADSRPGLVHRDRPAT